MPFITDYICRNCQRKWEEMLDSRESEIEICPYCQSENIERVLGGTITTCHDPAVLRETLKKRSADHTLKLVKSRAGHRGTLPPNFDS